MLKYFVRGMFIVVPILMVLMMIWNFIMFQECRADGHKAYQCQAMLSDSHYVAVEDISNR